MHKLDNVLENRTNQIMSYFAKQMDNTFQDTRPNFNQRK